MKTWTKVTAILLTAVSCLTMVSPAFAAGIAQPISSLNDGAVVYDDTWDWEYRTGNNYTGTGVTQPVKWIVVDRNHSGYPSDSVTLLSQQCVAKHNYNAWTTSGTLSSAWDGTCDSLRDFLNNEFYNAFSTDFRAAVSLTENLPNWKFGTGYYTTDDNVFILSPTELGAVPATWEIGSVISYFTIDASNRRPTQPSMGYWTRSPAFVDWSGWWATLVWGTGWMGLYSSDQMYGARPAVNVRGETQVARQADGTYRIIYDRTPPVTSIVLDGTAGENGWFRSNVTVTLNAADDYSEVSGTWVSVDGAPAQPYAGPLVLAADGDYTLSYFSVDSKGNSEAPQTYEVHIDTTPPASPSAPELQAVSDTGATDDDNLTNADCLSLGGTAGADCTVVSLYDGGSLVGNAVVSGGVWTISLPQVSAGEHVFTAAAVDLAGNLSQPSESLVVFVDRTPPTITGAPDRSPNEHGWYNSDVTVSFTADDSSGLDSLTEPVVLGEGQGQTVVGRAVDMAGNEATATVGVINIDQTAPAISVDGNAGIYGADEYVNITVAAASLAPVTVTPASVSGPAYTFGVGENNTPVTAQDLAGNTSSATVTFTVKITSAALANLASDFCTDADVAESLKDQVESIQSALASGNKNATAGKVKAFINHVKAQTGKSIAADKAQVLINLVQTMK